MKKTIIYIGFLLAFVGTAQAQEGLKEKSRSVMSACRSSEIRFVYRWTWTSRHCIFRQNRSLSLLPSLRMDTAIIRLPEVDVMGRRQYIQLATES